MSLGGTFYFSSILNTHMFFIEMYIACFISSQFDSNTNSALIYLITTV